MELSRIGRLLMAIVLSPFIILVSQERLLAEGLVVEKAEKETQIYGYTRGVKSMTLSSEVPGRIVKINYNVGDPIGSAPIIEIDPTFINFKIEQSLISLKKLEINIERLKSNIAYLEKEFKRIDGLHKNDSIAEVKRDEAYQGVTQARLELASVTQDKEMMMLAIKELKEQKSRHSLKVPNETCYVDEDVFVRSGPSTDNEQMGKLFKGAQIKKYEDENGFTRIGPDKWIISSVIRSKPSKGLIMTVRLVEVGEMIAPGIPLARISDYRELAVPLTLTGQELTSIKALPDPFTGMLEGAEVKVSVNWINPEFDEITRKTHVELVVKNYQGEKRGGLKLEIPLQTKTEGLLIPKAAVTNRYENPMVTIKDTAEPVSIIIIGESEAGLIIAENSKLAPGLELKPAAGEQGQTQR